MHARGVRGRLVQQAVWQYNSRSGCVARDGNALQGWVDRGAQTPWYYDSMLELPVWSACMGTRGAAVLTQRADRRLNGRYGCVAVSGTNAGVGQGRHLRCQLRSITDCVTRCAPAVAATAAAGPHLAQQRVQGLADRSVCSISSGASAAKAGYTAAGACVAGPVAGRGTGGCLASRRPGPLIRCDPSAPHRRGCCLRRPRRHRSWLERPCCVSKGAMLGLRCASVRRMYTGEGRIERAAAYVVPRSAFSLFQPREIALCPKKQVGQATSTGLRSMLA